MAESFHFQNIGVPMDEARYLEARTLITGAAALFGDGEGGELGDNAEYERGIVELICDRAGLNHGDHRDEVLAEIYAVAASRGVR